MNRVKQFKPVSRLEGVAQQHRALLTVGCGRSSRSTTAGIDLANGPCAVPIDMALEGFMTFEKHEYSASERLPRTTRCGWSTNATHPHAWTRQFRRCWIRALPCRLPLLNGRSPSSVLEPLGAQNHRLRFISDEFIPISVELVAFMNRLLSDQTFNVTETSRSRESSNPWGYVSPPSSSLLLVRTQG